MLDADAHVRTRHQTRSGRYTGPSRCWKRPWRRRPGGRPTLSWRRMCLPPIRILKRCCTCTKRRMGSNGGLLFGTDPLFLASSVFVKKVERVMATGFVMVLCLLIYRLAEQRLRQRLGETGATMPDQLKKPTQRPTMRWVFQSFEGISIVLVQQGDLVEVAQVTGLTDIHLLILRLLGPPYEKYYKLS